MSDENRIDRRQFAKCITAVSGSAAAIFAVQANSLAVDDPQNDKAKTDNTPMPKPELPVPKSLAQEILLLRLLLERYPSDHIDETAIRGIVADLRGDIARGRVLSQFGLKNSDEPCSVFRAYRSPE